MIEITQKDIEFGKEFRLCDPLGVKMMKILGNECPLFLKLTIESSNGVMGNFGLKAPFELNGGEARKLFFDIYYYIIGAFYSACGEKFPNVSKKEWETILEKAGKESEENNFISGMESMLIGIYSLWEKTIIPILRKYKFLEKAMYKIAFAFLSAEETEKINVVSEAERIIKERKSG